MPFCLRLPRDLFEEMLAQAKHEYPEECCGLLAGTFVTDGAVGLVLGRYPLINAAKSGVLFESDPRSTFDAVKDVERRQWQILAIYHSHPTSAPIPSKTDLERNYDPDVMNLIISLQGAEPLVRAWFLTAVDYREATWIIEEVEPQRHRDTEKTKAEEG